MSLLVRISGLARWLGQRSGRARPTLLAVLIVATTTAASPAPAATWYLLDRPWALGARDRPVRVERPLREWEVVGSYASADECRAAREHARLEMRARVENEWGTRHPDERTEILDVTESLRCVSADDPELGPAPAH